MRYLSVCSGIEAATCAWHGLGWVPWAFSEIEAFPSAVLAHHYPNVPNLGDMTKFKDWPDATIDLLVGGTPCQSFSVAGLRKGLADPRGNLMLTYLAIADRYRPRWLVWENVPGVLSSGGGEDFGSLLGGLAELGYGFAYRVLDAQYLGVAQRRRRVFVVGYLGDWRRAAAVLFERHSLQGNPAPSREAGKGVARPIAAGSRRGSGYRNDTDTADNLIPAPHADISPALKARDSKGASSDGDGDGDGAILVPMVAGAICRDSFSGGSGGRPEGASAGHFVVSNDPAHAICANEGKTYTNEGSIFQLRNVAAYSIMPMNSAKDYKARETDIAQPLMAGGPVGGNQGGDFILSTMRVRRLTPRECERLQGFPDDYTLIQYRNKPTAHGPRYKALGNSMAVPVMRWIGERIAMVEAIHATQKEAA